MRFADFSVVMIDRSETTAAQTETEQLTKLLELELAQKRATWKQAGERARSIRSASFVFLFLLIVACLVGGYFVFMLVDEQRTNPPAPSAAVDH
jgi:hypothetical protein